MIVSDLLNSACPQQSRRRQLQSRGFVRELYVTTGGRLSHACGWVASPAARKPRLATPITKRLSLLCFMHKAIQEAGTVAGVDRQPEGSPLDTPRIRRHVQVGQMWIKNTGAGCCGPSPPPPLVAHRNQPHTRKKECDARCPMDRRTHVCTQGPPTAQMEHAPTSTDRLAMPGRDHRGITGREPSARRHRSAL